MPSLQTGITLRLEQTVMPADSARAFGSGLVDVFATPAMIALMEKTSLQLVVPFLAVGENTVGTHVDVKHLKATPIGKKVWCDSTLETIEGGKLVFRVEAYDERGLIGSGTHTRYVIDEARFLSQLQ